MKNVHLSSISIIVGHLHNPEDIIGASKIRRRFLDGI